MAMDMFLEVIGVKGESRDKTKKEKMDILAWSWGASNSGTAHVGGGAGDQAHALSPRRARLPSF